MSDESTHQPPESPSPYTTAVEELVAIGAAIACNCEPCFKHHFREAMNLGVPRADMAMAVTTARKVKEHIAGLMQKVAGEQLAAAQEVGTPPGSCSCSVPPSKSPERR